MDKQPVLIIGSSGHAKVIIDIFEKEAKYKIIGLLDDYRAIGDKTLGYEIVGKIENLPLILSDNPLCKVFVAIGDNWLRKIIVDKVISMCPNVCFTSAIHPSVQIAKSVQLGKGVAAMAGAIINSDTEIGNFTIINTKASIDHDGKMLDFASLAPNATLGGNVTVGEHTSISIGATVKHNLVIGNHSIIGAGALLMQDCGNNCIMYGLPAKLIRHRTVGEKYL